jgi:hypothetical protein
LGNLANDAKFACTCGSADSQRGHPADPRIAAFAPRRAADTADVAMIIPDLRSIDHCAPLELAIIILNENYAVEENINKKPLSIYRLLAIRCAVPRSSPDFSFSSIA